MGLKQGSWSRSIDGPFKTPPITSWDLENTEFYIYSRDGRVSYFFHGAGRGKAKNLWGRAGNPPPPPHSAGQGGEGVKICGAGRGQGGEHTACISWLKSYAAAKEILICIASCEVNLLNIHNLDRNHN